MLRHGILGLINYGDKTGYEIMTDFRQSLNYFWYAQTSQIYRELKTMEKAGWIAQTRVEQRGRTDKNVFSITEAGRAELVRWLREDNLPETDRSPLLLKTFFLGECPVDENLEFFQRLRRENVFPDGGAEASGYAESGQQEIDRPERSAYWKMTIRFAQMYEQMLHAWCDECIGELNKMKEREENEPAEKDV